jgi:hypothetical protein
MLEVMFVGRGVRINNAYGKDPIWTFAGNLADGSRRA